MKALEFFPNRPMHFDIVQLGAGGNGGYIIQRLSKLLSSLGRLDSIDTSFSYTIADLDQVEEKNLQRQPFLPKDVGQNKAKVLAQRYGKSYQVPIFYREEYIESIEELYNCFPSLKDSFMVEDTVIVMRILIGAVDNHASRKIMHEYFMKDQNLIYIDCGVDGILTEGEEEDIRRSGYGGHCVCGIHYNGVVKLPPVGLVYQDILEDKESLLPSQSCGQNIVSQPQRMQTNEMAALITMGYLNQLLAERRLYHHMTNFNALTHSSRATLLPVK